MLCEIGYSRKLSLYTNLEQTPEGSEESHVDTGDQCSKGREELVQSPEVHREADSMGASVARAE